MALSGKQSMALSGSAQQSDHRFENEHQ